MGSDLEAALHELKARAQIPDLIYKYALGVTTSDVELYTSCFAPDAELEFSFRKLRGLPEIKEFFTATAAQSSGKRESGVALEKKVASTPLVGNILITVDGDTAHSESTAIVCHDGFRDGKQVTIFRGVRYSDDFVLLDSGWKIKRRVHDAKWGTEVVSG